MRSTRCPNGNATLAYQRSVLSESKTARGASVLSRLDLSRRRTTFAANGAVIMPNTHQTTDLTVAAFLLAHEHPLAEVQGPRRVVHFPGKAATDARRFYQGATIPARTFANAFRHLKALVRVN